MNPEQKSFVQDIEQLREIADHIDGFQIKSWSTGSCAACGKTYSTQDPDCNFRCDDCRDKDV